ncbi:hypothetical protein ACFVU3_26970 [Streptomyces sp. NPDC058052]|uniref:hypothetical protein n=1 Tax=Streptomyces sp. NPDC058052 TaxID=3346316 RepID=UPI0036E79EC3
MRSVNDAASRTRRRYRAGEVHDEGAGVLEQAWVLLAAAGGTAVVQAAGTDAWAGLRQAVARWFGRGDAQRAEAELERLDQTAAAVQVTDPAEAERSRSRQEVVWQTRIETLLESLDGIERQRAAEQLRSLLSECAPRSGVTAGPGGLVANTVDVHAEQGSIAAGVIHGGAQIVPPPVPDPSQG